MQTDRQSAPEGNGEIDRLIEFYGASAPLAHNKLYKVYLLCPKLMNHVSVKDENLVSLLGSFRDYFNSHAAQQNILFEEDQPHHLHHFSHPDTSLLVLLAPPNLIVCIDGRLLLQAEKIITECILGMYLTAEAEKFSMSTHFSMEKIRRWIDKDSDSSANTDFDLPTNTDYA
jgi:hypothetical protein